MKVAVVGGGLTGALTALRLADDGHGVVIFDRADRLLTRASAANEGKIHLGYVYGADRSFATAARMIDDALQFRAIVERVCTQAEFEACLFAPFRYLVPDDSSVPEAEVVAHFQRVDLRVRQRSEELGVGYLGADGHVDCAVLGARSSTGALQIDTGEAGVWPEGIARLVRAAVDQHPRIDVLTGMAVDRVSDVGRLWSVHVGCGARHGPFDAVVNAAWADRRNIDARSGFCTDESWFTRLKFGVLLHDAAATFGGDLPRNTTGMLGPYGDSVYYPQNDTLYCSWYPVGRRFGTTGGFDLDLPDLDGEVERLAVESWAGYATLDPKYCALAEGGRSHQASLIGDYIMAKGQSDIEDAGSQLHQRADHGPRQLAPGYWTVETGKYTSAPRVADEVATALLGVLVG